MKELTAHAGSRMGRHDVQQLVELEFKGESALHGACGASQQTGLALLGQLAQHLLARLNHLAFAAL